MNFFCRALPALSCILLLAACGPSKKITDTHRLLDTVTISARNNPMDIYRAASPRVWEIEHTDVTLRFDFEKKEATGNATLAISPYAAPADTLTLDAKGMVIQRVYSWNDKSGTSSPLPYSYDSSQLKILVKGLPFGDLAPNGMQAIGIDYIARPYASEAGGSAAIREDRGLYFINTDRKIPGKPVQIWTQGETESNSHWLPTIDKPNQRTTTDITLIVPDSMTTLSNGKLVESHKGDSGLRTDHWRMSSHAIQVYAVMFAIGRFDITKDTSYTDPNGGEHPVSYYTEPAYTPFAARMFQHTPEMIAFFSKKTGVPYPWNKYSQVVVRDYVSGAMENTSASLFGEFVNQNGRQLLDAGAEDVVSHELFHQWFGDYVTAESWSNLTLNESFATYGEVLWRRYKYGGDRADELSYGDLQRYLAFTQRADPPLVRYYYREREEMFDRVSYQKGGAILHYIHAIAGDTLFSRAMAYYLRSNAMSSAEASQWRLALEHATGRDWQQFFSQWYYRGGHPVLRVSYNYNDAARMLTVTVRQASSPDSAFKYILPLKAAIISKGVQRMEDWTISERTQTFSYAYGNGARPVVIPDAGHVLPGVIQEDKKPAEWLEQMKASDNAISRRLALDAAFSVQADAASLQIMELGLKDPYPGNRQHALQLLVRVKSAGWKDALSPQVKYMAQTETINKVQAEAFTVLGAWEIKSEQPAMLAATADSSYLVSGAALAALTQIAPDSAYAVARRILLTDPKGLLHSAAWTAVVSKGVPADITRFEAEARYVYGTVKTGFAGNMQRYAMAVKVDALYERTLQLLQSMAAGEDIRGYRYAIGSDVFELRDYYRKESGRSGAAGIIAKARLAITERYAAQILAAEKDPANVKQYRALGK